MFVCKAGYTFAFHQKPPNLGHTAPSPETLSDGTMIPFLNFMKFIEAYKSLFGTGSIFKRFHRTHHKVVFYLAMEERKLFLSAMNASKQFF